MLLPSRFSPVWLGIILGLAVVLLVVGALAYYLRPPLSSPNPHIAGFGKSISVNGHIVCLPHKDTSGPQTLECAYGLQGDDNYYYGLQDLDQPQLLNGAVSPQKYVSVVGTLQKPAAGNRYNIYGNIEVSHISVHP